MLPAEHEVDGCNRASLAGSELISLSYLCVISKKIVVDAQWRPISRICCCQDWA